MKNVYLTVFCLCLFCSCVNTKRFGEILIRKNQTVFISEKKDPKDASVNPEIVIREYKLNKALVAKLNNTLTEKRVVFAPTNPQSLNTDLVQTHSDSEFGTLDKGYFFPYPKTDANTVGEKLKILEMKPVWQAISIPLKIRYDQTYPVSAPYVAEGGTINLGVAYGWKFSYKNAENLYSSSDKKFLNKSIGELSLTPAAFLGPSLVRLSSTRSVAGIHYGVIGVVGVNQVSLGVATGIEHAIGQGIDWPYNGKLWSGFVLTFDFVK